MTTYTCNHCGATDVGTPEAGYARGAVTDHTPGNRPGNVVAATLCHPNAPGRPDCYRLVTVYQHSMPCRVCASTVKSSADAGAAMTAAVEYWTARLDRLTRAITDGAQSPYPGIRYIAERRKPERQHLAVLLRTLGVDVPELPEVPDA